MSLLLLALCIYQLIDRENVEAAQARLLERWEKCRQ